MTVAIPTQEALRLQLAAIAGSEPASSFWELRALDPRGRCVVERAWVPVRDGDQVGARVADLAPRRDVYLGVAPRVRQGGRAVDVERAHVLWCDCDGSEALERLASFRPLPSIVVCTGRPDRAHAYWPLRAPATPGGAQRANRRLALALAGDMAATDPARILRPVGSLNHKTDPPGKVIATRLELDVFDLAEVVGGLPDSDHYRSASPRPRFAGEPARVLSGLVATVEQAQEGERNARLFWAACRVCESAEPDSPAAWDSLRLAALRTGLSEPEIERTIASALRSGA